MQQPQTDIAWKDRPYLDRIWATTQLPWLVRDRLMELHRLGVLEYQELSVGALNGFGSSGLDTAGGLQLLDSWTQLVKFEQEQQPRPADWKSGLLLDLLRQQARLPVGSWGGRGCPQGWLRHRGV
jgi:hypothetical protein